MELFDFFPKISNIVYTNNFHFNYIKNDKFTDNSELIKIEVDRINNFKHIHSPKSPKYLFLSLTLLPNDKSINISNVSCAFGIFNDTKDFKWFYKNDKIYSISRQNMVLACVDNNLILVHDSTDDTNNEKATMWKIINKKIKNIITDNFLCCDINYNICFTKNENLAIEFVFENNGMHFIKPDFRLKFDMHVVKLNLNTNDLLTICNKIYDNGINVCILLAAGKGTRFGSEIPKQITVYKNKLLIEYSINAIIKKVDIVIIVTNSTCSEKISKVINKKKVIIVENNEDCRLKSISVGLEKLKEISHFKKINNVIIHDSARAFITQKCIKTIITQASDFHYVQYYLPIVDGLIDNDNNIYDNKNFSGLCTPICVKYPIFLNIFDNFIKHKFTYEFIPILNMLNVKYCLIKGDYDLLRKITFHEDLKLL